MEKISAVYKIVNTVTGDSYIGSSRNAKGLDVEKRKEVQKKYDSQLCSYNGETLTLSALSRRFQRMKIPHATTEAKKYLINTTQ